LGNKRSNIRRFEEKGIRIAWEKGEIEEGCFVLTCGPIAVKGSIFDACRPSSLITAENAPRA
jgi:hypothetical protein